MLCLSGQGLAPAARSPILSPRLRTHPCNHEPKTASRKQRPAPPPSSSTHHAHRVSSPLPRHNMFSPDASFHGVHGALSRNPRRRQRHDSDSAKNQPDRKRSKISDTTFLDPASPAVNGNGPPGLNGHTVNGDEKRRSALRHEIPVREKKHSAAPARSVKGDGSTTLVCMCLVSMAIWMLTDTIDAISKLQSQAAA